MNNAPTMQCCGAARATACGRWSDPPTPRLDAGDGQSRCDSGCLSLEAYHHRPRASIPPEHRHRTGAHANQHGGAPRWAEREFGRTTAHMRGRVKRSVAPMHAKLARRRRWPLRQQPAARCLHIVRVRPHARTHNMHLRTHTHTRMYARKKARTQDSTHARTHASTRARTQAHKLCDLHWSASTRILGVSGVCVGTHHKAAPTTRRRRRPS